MSSTHHQFLSTKMPPPVSSSSLVSKETKNLIRTLVVSCACHIIRGLARATSFLARAAQRKLERLQIHLTMPSRNGRNNKKIYLGSFRFHYNWASASSSSRMQTFPSKHLYYYHPTWNSMISMETGEEVHNAAGDQSSQLSKYLEWLEEKENAIEVDQDGGNVHEGCGNEIDKLADMFIEKCHEMFILEKEESYRRFQEMIAT